MSDRKRPEVVTDITPETFFGIVVFLMLGILLLAGFFP